MRANKLIMLFILFGITLIFLSEGVDAEEPEAPLEDKTNILLEDDSLIESTGTHGESGSFFTIDTSNVDGAIKVSYDYLYMAGNNYAFAYIYTNVDGTAVDTLEFKTPKFHDTYKEDKSLYYTHSFIIDEPGDELELAFKNGDWRIMITNVLIEGNALIESYVEEETLKWPEGNVYCFGDSTNCLSQNTIEDDGRLRFILNNAFAGEDITDFTKRLDAVLKVKEQGEGYAVYVTLTDDGTLEWPAGDNGNVYCFEGDTNCIIQNRLNSKNQLRFVLNNAFAGEDIPEITKRMGALLKVREQGDGYTIWITLTDEEAEYFAPGTDSGNTAMSTFIAVLAVAFIGRYWYYSKNKRKPKRRRRRK